MEKTPEKACGFPIHPRLGMLCGENKPCILGHDGWEENRDRGIYTTSAPTPAVEEAIKDFIEKGAAIEHARWSKWMEYMFDCAVRSGDDNLGIRTFAFPTAQVENWERQMEADYSELSEHEKESDRREVRSYEPMLHEKLTLLAREERKTLREIVKGMKKPLPNITDYIHFPERAPIEAEKRKYLNTALDAVLSRLSEGEQN